ncbi:MAG: DUF1993 domain-containing protein [Deltaproteobacteria bacterium]
MSISLHTASTTTFLAMLANLASIMKKGEASATERKIDPSVFLNGRLAPDMLPLTRQIMIATDNAKGAAFRLAGIEVPKMADTETTFEELQARIATVIEMVKGIPASAYEGREDATITLPGPNNTSREFKALDYLFAYAIPNFQFHVVTAYNILRHNGVAIGKGDYFGR